MSRQSPSKVSSIGNGDPPWSNRFLISRVRTASLDDTTTKRDRATERNAPSRAGRAGSRRREVCVFLLDKWKNLDRALGSHHCADAVNSVDELGQSPVFRATKKGHRDV